jgi:hypothetical protein
LHEARKAALNAQRAVVHPTDLDRARRALTLCQEHFHHIEKQFAVELVSYEKLRELARLGRERRSWLPWANTAKLGIEQCRPPLEKISTALAACWLELAERLGMVSVSVRTIGQQIKMPAEASVLDAEPVT